MENFRKPCSLSTGKGFLYPNGFPLWTRNDKRFRPIKFYLHQWILRNYSGTIKRVEAIRSSTVGTSKTQWSEHSKLKDLSNLRYIEKFNLNYKKSPKDKNILNSMQPKKVVVLANWVLHFKDLASNHPDYDNGMTAIQILSVNTDTPLFVK